MSASVVIREALAAGEGIVRLEPAWVPRSFLVPGGRLRLDPRDLYALGVHRGGIDERWFSSTTQADNGPGTPQDEGLSYIHHRGQRALLREAMDTRGDELLGAEVMQQQGGWNLLCKFFDNQGPIPHHMHQSQRQAQLVGRNGKPEAYYFPRHYNTAENRFPYTFMGLEPGVTKADVRGCLERWHEGDNGILFLSKAYKLQPGTGWQLDAGILHAPGSLVTYEPQVNSDVGAVFQSQVDGRPVGWDMLVKDVPPEYHHDLDYLVDMLDWEANLDPAFRRNRQCFPRPVRDPQEMAEAGYREEWIVYSTPLYSAKELTVLPQRTVTLTDPAAYGLIVVQGRGQFGALAIESPTLIRFGQMTQDELFVSASRAQEGVTIANTSETESLVILKHFGPGNPQAPLGPLAAG